MEKHPWGPPQRLFAVIMRENEKTGSLSSSPRNAIKKADAAPNGAAFPVLCAGWFESLLSTACTRTGRGFQPHLPFLIAHGQTELPEGPRPDGISGFSLFGKNPF